MLTTSNRMYIIFNLRKL